MMIKKARLDNNTGSYSSGDSGKEQTFDRNELLKIINNKELEFVAEIVSSFTQTVNDKYWNFNIKGFAEPLQFLTYKKGGKYDSHMDINWENLNSKRPNRKITTIIQLTDDDKYYGGDLKIDVDNKNDFFIPRKKGDIVCFPSFLLHKVFPVKKGVRHSIVSWLSMD